jgi:hypothetical protein
MYIAYFKYQNIIRGDPMKPLYKLICLVVFLLIVPGISSNIYAAGGIVTIKMVEEGIKIKNLNHYFFGPYSVQKGDTFRNIAKRYYGDTKFASYLSDFNNAPVETNLEIGSTIYLFAHNFSMKYDPLNFQKQYREIKRFIQAAGPESKFTYISKASMSIHTINGDMVYRKFNPYEFTFTALKNNNLTMTLFFKETPMVEVLTGNTIIESIKCKGLK